MKKIILTIVVFNVVLCTTDAWAQVSGILNPKVKWTFKADGPIRGQAQLDKGEIYFGSSDGYLYALTQNGDLRWKFHTQGAITNRPALSGTLAIIASNDNFVYAINRNNGHLAWKFQMQSLLPSYWEWDYYTASPVLSDGRIYVGSGDGNLYVLSEDHGKLLWKYKTSGRIRAAPLVAKGTVYQPSNDGVVYVLDAGSGKLRWKFETEGASLDSRKFGWDRNSIYSTPVLADSILIIASRDGKTYAINCNSHKEKWNFTYGPSWGMSVSLDRGVVFTGWSDSNLLSAVDLSSGKEKWKFKAGAMVYTTPLIYGNNIYIGSTDENIYCLDKESGEMRWNYATKGCVYSSPVMGDNTLVVGNDSGYLYALEDGPKPMKAVYQPIPRNQTMEQTFTVDKKIAPYLKDRGFEQLDSARLYHFVRDRIQDGAPSVIVFSYDLIPTNIVGDNPRQGMIRKYLETGGKIIWFGNTPNFLTFDESGQFKINLNTAAEMLDIEIIRPEESGNYYSKATQMGLNWGLPSWLTTTYATVSEKSIVPLTYDEFDRVGAWMKKFNPRPGSGFISCRTWSWYAPVHEDDLELIYRLAIHELE